MTRASTALGGRRGVGWTHPVLWGQDGQGLESSAGFHLKAVLKGWRTGSGTPPRSQERDHVKLGIFGHGCGALYGFVLQKGLRKNPDLATRHKARHSRLSGCLGCFLAEWIRILIRCTSSLPREAAGDRDHGFGGGGGCRASHD